MVSINYIKVSIYNGSINRKPKSSNKGCLLLNSFQARKTFKPKLSPYFQSKSKKYLL